LFKEYKWISAVHSYYVVMVIGQSRREERAYAQKYFHKTLKYIHKSTEIEDLDKELPIIEFDEHYMQKLEEKVKTTEEKAANIIFTLNRFVLVEKYKNPIYETLTQRVERIVKLWKERTKDFEKIYKEGLQTLAEINKLTARQKKLDFSDLQYSMLLAFEKQFGSDIQLEKDVKELSKQIQQHMFSGWFLQKTARKNIEREVRRFMRRYVTRYRIKLDQMDKLYQQIMENVKTYGKKT